MGRRYDTVSFLSDFGTTDEFVGVVKSVIRTLAPHVSVVDLTHDIPVHDVRTGALTLVRSVQYLAPGIVLAVVDPGVGTSRRAIAVEASEGEAVFVGPDNGLLGAAVAMVGGAERAVELTNEELHLPAPGPTFAARDVFAPATAHLCSGADLSDLGEAIDPVTLRPGILPLPSIEADQVAAEVLWVDRFGNVQLNVGPEDVAGLGDRFRVRWGEDQTRTAVRARVYGDLKAGELGAVVDSYGLVSLAFDRSSAAAQLRLRPGDGVRLELLG